MLFAVANRMSALFSCRSIKTTYLHVLTIYNNLFHLLVSIKMNMLLYAPGILLVLLLGCGLVETILCLSICAGVQLVLAYPFLSTYPVEYLQRSFDLGRVFMHKWTVNYKFVPEDIFASKPFSLILLGLTVVGEFLSLF